MKLSDRTSVRIDSYPDCTTGGCGFFNGNICFAWFESMITRAPSVFSRNGIIDVVVDNIPDFSVLAIFFVANMPREDEIKASIVNCCTIPMLSLSGVSNGSMFPK